MLHNFGRSNTFRDNQTANLNVSIPQAPRKLDQDLQSQNSA